MQRQSCSDITCEKLSTLQNIQLIISMDLTGYIIFNPAFEQFHLENMQEKQYVTFARSRPSGMGKTKTSGLIMSNGFFFLSTVTI